MSHFNAKFAMVRLPKLLLLLSLAALMASLGSCALTSSRSQSQSDSTAASETATSPAPLKIVATTIPLTNFAKAVAGDRAEVTYLLPTNTAPHDFQARPNDVRTVAEATVLVQNGLELENYLDNLVSNAGNPDLKIIDTSEGIQPFARQAEHTEPDQTETDQAETDQTHEHGEFDPHVWLDPKRASQQVENIRDGLIAADPDGKELYTANAAAYIEQLKALDREIAEALKPYVGQEFITYHDFAFYFAQSYGLKAKHLVGMPEENPSPEDVKRVLETVQTRNLKVLLTEPQAGDGQFAALANDLDVQVSGFDPMETSGAEGLEPNYYLKTMQQNVENLKAAFGQAQQ
jgi:zinc/manganese transport system substrate-binding protein